MIGFKVLRGFSLIELLVVLSIIGILFAVIIPAYKHQIASARKSEIQVLMVTLQGQLERYLYDYGSYPKSLSDMQLLAGTELSTQNGEYELSLEKGDAECPAGSCYVIVAKLLNSESDDEDLKLHSNGKRGGAW